MGCDFSSIYLLNLIEFIYKTSDEAKNHFKMHHTSNVPHSVFRLYQDDV